MRKVFFGILVTSFSFLTCCKKESKDIYGSSNFPIMVASALNGGDTIQNFIMVLNMQMLNSFPVEDSSYSSSIGGRFTQNGNLVDAGMMKVGAFTINNARDKVYAA